MNIELFDEMYEYINMKFNVYGNALHSRDWKEEKVHSDFDVWFLTDGGLSINFEGETSSAFPGDIILMKPGIKYTAAANENGCSFSYIHFSIFIENTSEFIKKLPLSGVFSSHSLGFDLQAFLDIFKKFTDKAPMARLMLKGEFLKFISNILVYQNSMPLKFKYEIDKDKFNNIEQILEYIKKSADYSLDIKSIAHYANMSEKYFIRYFKKYMGVSPGIYIKNHRIERAKQYLLGGEHSIKEVAVLLGFSDPYAFSKAFKKGAGMSPTKYIQTIT